MRLALAGMREWIVKQSSGEKRTQMRNLIAIIMMKTTEGWIPPKYSHNIKSKDSEQLFSLSDHDQDDHYGYLYLPGPTLTHMYKEKGRVASTRRRDRKAIKIAQRPGPPTSPAGLGMSINPDPNHHDDNILSMNVQPTVFRKFHFVPDRSPALCQPLSHLLVDYILYLPGTSVASSKFSILRISRNLVIDYISQGQLVICQPHFTQILKVRLASLHFCPLGKD